MTAFRLAVLLALGLNGAPGHAAGQTLQQSIDAALPGDTVFVAPGDYTRAVEVDKAVTLLATGPGESRLAGLAGSVARVDGIVFDGSLGPGGQDLVRAGSGLTLRNCAFRNGLRGVFVDAGALNVLLEHCTLQGLLEGVTLADTEAWLRIVDSDFLGCTRGVTGLAPSACAPPPRGPATPCEPEACGRVELQDTRFTGGTLPIGLTGPLDLVLLRVETAQTDTGLVARDVRLDIDGSRFQGPVNQGVGFRLTAVSGTVRRTRVSGWADGIRVGDGGCAAYSDLVLGGDQESGNDIVGNPVNLRLEQPEWINAEFNYWGSLDCNLVAASLQGQRVRILMADDHRQGVVCVLDARPATWGALKGRFGEGPRP